jgi:hypothetical protein
MSGSLNVFVEWRVTSATHFRFLELINEYEQTMEGSDDAFAITEGIRSLPGYPTTAPVGSDIQLVITDKQH